MGTLVQVTLTLFPSAACAPAAPFLTCACSRRRQAGSVKGEEGGPPTAVEIN